MPDLPVVRAAIPADATRLAVLAEATFRATFGSVNTAADMDRHCSASYGEAIQRAEISNPGMFTLLSEVAGEFVGFAQLRWGHAPACVIARSPGEIQRLYVAGDWHGKRVAQGLMDVCLSELARRGSDVAWLGVWEHNPRAISFYAKYGFVEVGEHVFTLGGDPQRDRVMARALAPRARAQAPYEG